MAMPLRYPWRKPYGALLFTTLGMLVMLLPGTVCLERMWGITLPSHGVETIVAVSILVGLVVAGAVFYRQSPPESGDLDDPNW